MSRSIRPAAVAAALGLAAALFALLCHPAPASAEVLGGLTVNPATGTDILAPQVITSAGCPATADGYSAVLTGPGAFAAGFLITPTQDPGFSTTAGFPVQLGLSFKDAATELGTTITAGDYTVTVNCLDTFTGEVKGSFAGVVTFTSPTEYRSGTAGTPSGSASVSPSASSASPSASATSASPEPEPEPSESPTDPAPTPAATTPTTSPTPTTTPAAVGLPVTGPPTAGLVMVGVLFVLAGAVTVVAAGTGRRAGVARP